MYKIFFRVGDSKKHIIEHFEAYIMKEGTTIITNPDWIGEKPV